MSEGRRALANGAGTAAVLAAGIGVFSMALLAVIADHSSAFRKCMIFSSPVGALSGESTCAVAVWLVLWVALDVAWKRREMPAWLTGAGLALMGLGFLLMFPPIADLF